MFVFTVHAKSFSDHILFMEFPNKSFVHWYKYSLLMFRFSFWILYVNCKLQIIIITRGKISLYGRWTFRCDQPLFNSQKLFFYQYKGWKNRRIYRMHMCIHIKPKRMRNSCIFTCCIRRPSNIKLMLSNAFYFNRCICIVHCLLLLRNIVFVLFWFRLHAWTIKDLTVHCTYTNIYSICKMTSNGCILWFDLFICYFIACNLQQRYRKNRNLNRNECTEIHRESFKCSNLISRHSRDATNVRSTFQTTLLPQKAKYRATSIFLQKTKNRAEETFAE